MPTVAICIPTYNQSAFLPLTIESALKQTFKSEIWISDDASTDNTEFVVNEIIKENPSVNYKRQSKNLGIAANNNWLLAQPNTDYIVRVDSDDLLEPTFVEKVVALLDENKTLGYGHVAVKEIDENGKFRRLRSLFRAPVINAEEALKDAISGYRVAANILMFRKEVLEQANFYNPELNFAEDWDLSVKIAALGYGNVYINTPLASYRVWTDSKNYRPRRKFDELSGIDFVLNNTLKNTYINKGWNTEPIIQQGKKFSLNHSIALSSNVFSNEEKLQLKKVLINLGDSKALKIKIKLIELGFSSVFIMQKKLLQTAKDLIKRKFKR
jgi:glycosyltransferase involved in cell wall biosynthesis